MRWLTGWSGGAPTASLTASTGVRPAPRTGSQARPAAHPLPGGRESDAPSGATAPHATTAHATAFAPPGTVRPLAATTLWSGPNPLWAVGDWRPEEIRLVTLRPGAPAVVTTGLTAPAATEDDTPATTRLAVLGHCGASDAELAAGLTSARGGAVRHLTAWPGSYTVVLRAGTRSTLLLTDLAGALPVFHAPWYGGTAYATAALPLADLIGAPIDTGHLAARLACPESPEALGTGTPYLGVQRVPPGHVLGIRSGRPYVAPYEHETTPGRREEAPAVRELTRALLESVRCRVRTSTPVGDRPRLGVDLSYGTASATVALLAAAVPIGPSAASAGPGSTGPAAAARSGAVKGSWARPTAAMARRAAEESAGGELLTAVTVAEADLDGTGTGGAGTDGAGSHATGADGTGADRAGSGARTGGVTLAVEAPRLHHIVLPPTLPYAELVGLTAAGRTTARAEPPAGSTGPAEAGEPAGSAGSAGPTPPAGPGDPPPELPPGPLTDEPGPALIATARLGGRFSLGGADHLTGYGARQVLDGHPARLADLVRDGRSRELLSPVAALAGADLATAGTFDGAVRTPVGVLRAAHRLARAQYAEALDDAAVRLTARRFARRGRTAGESSAADLAWCVPGPAARFLSDDALSAVALRLRLAARGPVPTEPPGARRARLALHRHAAEYRTLLQAAEQHGQRLHAPFLDNQVVRAARLLPDRTRLQPGARHALLRSVLTGAGRTDLPADWGRGPRPDRTGAARTGLRRAADGLTELFHRPLLAEAGLIDLPAVRDALARAADPTADLPAGTLAGLADLVATELWLRRVRARRHGSSWTGLPQPDRPALLRPA
ncbi:asparagine synthase-related protein [Saccharothrix sp. ST-888]|uniref:asparagine synthase-related protein n=1 Tax=Saccharothrix sp. ST-888 TaxID=1427391 RepID=UPI000B0F4340|nr:asparagine synthase-related protein [Saccharothrix sp. ST-888]